MSKLIAITGKAGSGKDYLYDRIVETFPQYEFENLKFTDILKGDIEDTLTTDLFARVNVPDGEGNCYYPLPTPLRLPILYDKPYSPEIRALLQWWGTDLRRSQDEDYWVNLMRQCIDNTRETGKIPVITDLRFVNEANIVIGYGGYIVRMWASETVRAERLGMTTDELTKLSFHSSEIEQAEIPQDLWIGNSSEFKRPFPVEVGNYLES